MKKCPECTLYSDDDTVRCGCGYHFEIGSSASSLDGAPTDLVEAAKQVKNGASWFTWIAGLSIVNSLLAFLGVQVIFVVGLGMTALLHPFLGTVLGVPMPNTEASLALLPVLIVEVLVALSFLAVSRAASRGFGPAFVVGGLIYLLDAGLCLIVQDWMMVAFHALALAYIIQGYLASRKLRQTASDDSPSRWTWKTSLQTAAPAMVFAPLILIVFISMAFAGMGTTEDLVLERAPENFTEADRARLHDAFVAVDARFQRDGEISAEEFQQMNEATLGIVYLGEGELASREQLLALTKILESIGGVTAPKPEVTSSFELRAVQ